MSTDFQMNYHHNKDNLHVKMQGIFDGNSAHELLNLFLREYRCGGRVFVDTTPVPASQLFFKGENGFNMAPSGSRVLIVPPRKKKSGCCGKCAHCTCHGEHGHGHGHGGCACRGEHNHDH